MFETQVALEKELKNTSRVTWLRKFSRIQVRSLVMNALTPFLRSQKMSTAVESKDRDFCVSNYEIENMYRSHGEH